MLITMYAEKPFPIEVRKTFELPAWPYTDVPEDFKDFEDYMKSLTVFRYDDSDCDVGGIDVGYHINIKIWDKPQVAPFLAYLYGVYVDDDFRPITWPGGRPEGEERMEQLREHPIAGDMLGWANWEVPVEVQAYSTTVIKRRILDEYLDKKLSHQGKCWSPKLGPVT